MADDEKPMSDAEREEQRNADIPFVEAMQAISGQNYLGELSTLQIMLKLRLKDAFDAIQSNQGTSIETAILTIAGRVARILLGGDDKYTAVPGWNQPGRIDVAMSESMGLADTDPHTRIEHAFMRFVCDALEVTDFAGTSGVLDEQWIQSLSVLIDRYALRFMGVSDVTQDAMMFEGNKNGTVQESPET
jgi:hypothetical protein